MSFVTNQNYRVPRLEIPMVVTPAKLGQLLVHCQHDEDGKFGLNVINEDQEAWRFVISRSVFIWSTMNI